MCENNAAYKIIQKAKNKASYVLHNAELNSGVVTHVTVMGER